VLAAVAFLALTMVAEHAVSADVATHTVVIENMRFSPEELTVKRGDRVVWVNKDLFPHTATAGSKAFDSGAIPAEKSWTYVATAAGRYIYQCSYHPGMKATLIVQ
jgi:plastocyanin